MRIPSRPKPPPVATVNGHNIRTAKMPGGQMFAVEGTACYFSDLKAAKRFCRLLVSECGTL